MKKVVALLFIILLKANCTAQVTFQKLYPTRTNHDADIIQTSDSSYVLTGGIVGTTLSTLMKINKDGSTGSLKEYETDTSAMHNSGSSIVQTSDGYVILTDNSELIRIDTTGNPLWTKKYGTSSGDVQSNLIQTNDGGFLFVNLGSNKLIIKTNAVGDTLWTKYYWRQLYGVLLYSVKQTSDNGYIFAGSTNENVNDCYLLKTDSLGNAQWVRSYGGSGNERFNSVIQNADGGYIACGYSFSSFTGQLGSIYMVRTNSIGDTLWTKVYTEPFAYFIVGTSVNKCNDGGFILAGMAEDTGTLISRPCMLKTDSTGNLMWAKNYGQGLKNRKVNAIQTLDGGYLCFSTLIDSINNSLYVIKTDAYGNSNCTESNPVVFAQGTPSVVIVPDTVLIHHLLPIINSTPIISSADTSEQTLCSFTHVPENAATAVMNLFPDPFTDKLTVSFSLETAANYNLLLTDIRGRTLYQTQLTATTGINKKEIQVGDLAKGIYIVTLTGEERSESMKVVKE